MPTFTYVTVSYCYVGVSYPVVGYAGEGYWRVSYPVVGYGSVGVCYRYVGGSYPMVGYRGVWCPEMWRRTHRWGLTRGVAVDRMEVQQRGKRERKPQWTSKSTSSKNSAATTPQTWQTSWKTSKADPKAPAPAGAFPCPQTRPEWPLRRLRSRGGATLPAKARQGLRGPSAISEGRPRRPGPCRLGCAPPETAPSNYATSVLRKSRNLKCELGLTFRNRD